MTFSNSNQTREYDVQLESRRVCGAELVRALKDSGYTLYDHPERHVGKSLLSPEVGNIIVSDHPLFKGGAIVTIRAHSSRMGEVERALLEDLEGFNLTPRAEA